MICLKIAIVSPSGLGGVQVITRKLFKALKYEDFNVDLFILGNGVLDTFVTDFKLVNCFKKYDTIVYTGSIARLSSVLVNEPRTALFIHGFIKEEYKKTFSHSDIKTKAGALIEFTWLQSVNMSLFKPDFFICHSVSTSKANRLKNSTLLPQFILSEEIALFEGIRRKSRENNQCPKILVYRSYADSPRLISQSSLVWVAKQLAKTIKRKTQFFIVDPTVKHEFIYQFGMIDLRIIPVMPRLVFLNFLASVDLYIETSIDEEIGLDSLEAGILKVPLAKITSPPHKVLQDYSDSEVLNASSIESLVNIITQYLSNLQEHKASYGERLESFVLKKRLWNSVKQHFIAELER